MANTAPVPAPAKENRFIAQAKESMANAAPVPAPAKENRFIAQAKESMANAAPVPAPAKENRFIAQAKKEETIGRSFVRTRQSLRCWPARQQPVPSAHASAATCAWRSSSPHTLTPWCACLC